VDLPDLSHKRHGLTRSLLLAALFFGLAAGLAYLIQPGFISSTNNRTTDLLMSLAPGQPASGAVVVVDIDEQSLARYGQWPWPRNRLAQLLGAVHAAGAGSIGLDLILAEPDRSSPENRRAAGAPHPLSCLPSEPTENDRRLAETLAGGPFVLGYEFLFGAGPKAPPHCGLHPPGLVWVGEAETARFFQARGVVCNRPQFSEAVRRSGFLNATPDADGILRRVPMLIRFEDRLYPSLTLAMLMQYEKSGQLEIRRGPAGGFQLKAGGRSLPVNDQGNLIVQFSTAESAPRVSAGDLLDGRVRPERLKGKAVLVGSSAAGLQPVYQTAAGPLHAHVEVHAQLLDNLLNGRLAVRNRSFLAWEALAGLLAALAAGLAIARLALLPSAFLCATLAAVFWGGAELIFRLKGYLLSPLLPTALLAFNYAVLTTYQAWKIQVAAREDASAALMQLKASEQNLHSIFWAVPDVIFRLDPAGRITFVSQAIAGYSASPDLLLGQSIFPLLKAGYRESFKKLVADVFQGKPGNLEYEAVDLKGRDVWLDTHAVPLYSETGEIVSLLGIARDITDRKLAEQRLVEKQGQLEEINRNLEERVAAAVRDLREKDRIMLLQSRQAAMGEMISNIAHQWRQPLNTLGLVVQELSLTYGSDEFNKESLDASVQKSMRLIAHMSQTIEDFSSYFKPDRVKRRFKVRQALSRTLALVEPSFKSSNIEIELVAGEGAEIDGFENEYSQVLLNLLLNCRDALEGAPPEKRRLITIVVGREKERSVVTVADNAGGIPEDIIEKIFEPYFTTKGPDKGTGIGLYMAKTIIEKNMGGRLTARNTADGAEFRIEV